MPCRGGTPLTRGDRQSFHIRKLLSHDFRNIYKQHLVGYFHNLAHFFTQRNDIRWTVEKLITQRKYTR